MRTALVLAVLTSCIGSMPGVRAQATQVSRPELPPAPGTVQIEHMGIQALAIVQDHQGFMWFGGFDGLYRYDGHELRHYRHDPGDSTSLGGPVETLFVDSGGTLWIGAFGLDRYDPETDAFMHFRHDPDDPTSLSHGGVGAILEDQSGALWVGTFQNGLNRMDRATGTFTRFRHDPDDPTSLGCDRVEVLYEDRRGTLWVGTGDPFTPKCAPDGGGLNRFEPQTGTFTRFTSRPGDPASLINNHVSALYEDAAGTFWVGTWGDGLHTMDRARGTFTRHRYDPGQPSKRSRPFLSGAPAPAEGCSTWECGGVKFIHEDRSGALWIGGFLGGVDRYDPAAGTRTHYEAATSGLEENTVVSLYESNDGTLWIGTWSGLYKVVPTIGAFRHYRLGTDNPDHPWGAVVRVFYEDRAGMVWIGTHDNGLYRWERASGVFTPYRHDPNDAASLGPGPVLSVFEDRDGVLWVGMDAPVLSRYDRATGTFTHYRHDPADSTSLPFNSVDVIFEDRRDRFWVGAYAWGGPASSRPPPGLARFDRATGRFTARYGNPEGRLKSMGQGVSALYEDEKGLLWAGTWGGGLSRFDPETETDTTYLAGRTVTALHRDREGLFWAATLWEGVYHLDPARGTSTSYGREEGLPDVHGAGLAEDDAGYLWISSRGRGATWIPEHGSLTRLDPRTGTFTYFDARDGLPDIGFMPGTSYKTRDGMLLFGGNKGFTAFDPAHVARAVARTPNVALTGLRVFNDEVAPGPDAPLETPIQVAKEIRLTHARNDFTVDYALLSFRDPATTQYAYRLEPHDVEWVNARTQRSARYSGLEPGTYVFRVRAVDGKGNRSEEASIRVVILPPWWRTWWAYGLYGLLLAAGVYGVDRFQRRRVVQKERQRAEVREARLRAETLEAENRRKELELEKAREVEALNAELTTHKEQLEAQNRRLVELDRAKSHFFANISHEFRTPLTLILGPLQDALASRDARPVQAHEVALMQGNAARLLQLINQLLDLSRLEAGAMHLRARKADLVSFLRGLVLAFSARAEREHLTLSLHSDEPEIPLYFDPDHLEKVVSNLLSNALKFTGAGGKIRVTAAVVRSEAGAFAQIVVKDTGPGIPPDKLPFIFDRFYQVDGSATRTHEGTGIGLALARELVELHGGTIEVESELGFGTTFSIRLPLGRGHLHPEQIVDEDGRPGLVRDLPIAWPPDAMEPVPEASIPVRAPEQAPVVLVVEDYADLRTYLRHHLGHRYRIEEAADGMEGLAQAQRLHPSLIIADVMMPRMDGYALCRAVRADPELNDVPVVLLTARADEESRLEALQLGADDYLPKPFSTAELTARTENLIELRRLLRQRFSGEVMIGPDRVAVPSEAAEFLERVRRVIQQRMSHSHFGVDQLAGEIGLSPRQVQRRLGELVGLSAAAYIRMMRLERAAQLLEQGAGPVSEIAYRVGFKNADHFSRLFHQVYGVPPSQYPTKRDIHLPNQDTAPE